MWRGFLLGVEGFLLGEQGFLLGEEVFYLVWRGFTRCGGVFPGFGVVFTG